MNCRTILALGFVTAIVGCTTSQPPADRPAMRAMGQAAAPEAGGSDEAIGTEIRRRLEIVDPGMTASVIVEVNNGIVTLRGSTATVQNAWRAEGAARAVPGVKDVRNEILAR